MDMDSDRPFTFETRVYYEDTDLAGIVYHANYFKFIERARSTLVEELGMDQNALRAAGVVFVVRRIEAEFRAPARMGDRLTVSTRLAPQSKARVLFHQDVHRGDMVLFSARVEVVAMSPEGRLRRLPGAILRR